MSFIEKDEERVKIEGLIFYEGQELIVNGLKEIENDEVEISLKAQISDTTYFEIEQEIENDEEEFKYKIVENNIVVYEYDIEIENEVDEELEVELKLKNLDSKYKISFEFKKVDNRTFIEVEVKLTGSDPIELLFEKVFNEEENKYIYKLVE